MNTTPRLTPVSAPATPKHDISQGSTRKLSLKDLAALKRIGLVLGRPASGPGHDVMGDPCIVWDDDIGSWRMFVFSAPPGHGHAVCRGGDPGKWEFLGPLTFTNPDDVIEPSSYPTHKPYVVIDAHHPNRAAKIGGRFCLLSVSMRAKHKVVQRAWASHLAGPWTWDRGPYIDLGAANDQDARHVDAVTAIHFPERDETLIYYMGYPETAQNHALSPFGSAQMLAISRGAGPAQKRGVLLPPSDIAGHWASGWVGGLQILPGVEHRWIAIANASPTAPRRGDNAAHAEEPPPSLPGIAVTDAEFPDRGWRWLPQPLEWISDIPADALANGEGVNLWRQHLLALPDGRWGLYYNSGRYGTEQMYAQMGLAGPGLLRKPR